MERTTKNVNEPAREASVPWTRLGRERVNSTLLTPSSLPARHASDPRPADVGLLVGLVQTSILEDDEVGRSISQFQRSHHKTPSLSVLFDIIIIYY